MIYYTVRPGDTLSQIAVSHGVDLWTIHMYNPQIDDINLIHPGQVIAIPSH